LSQLKASIIVNNYNYEAFLGETIDSALAQTYGNVEVIVVDDGSTDKSREIIASYGDAVVPVLKDNGGQGSAFNSGVEVAKGDVIVFLDSDDRLDKDCLERAMSHWQDNDSLLLFQLRVIDADGRKIGMNHPADSVMPTGSAREQVLTRGNYPAPPTSGLLFSMRALNKIFPLQVNHDECSVDSVLRILVPFLGDSRFIHEVLGDYRIHTNNYSSNFSRLKKIRRIMSSNVIKQELLESLGASEGFTVPPGLFEGGLKDAKGRLVSVRLDKEGHPHDGDSRLGLCKAGLSHSVKASGAGWAKRLATACWFLSVAFLPRFLLGPIIELAYREVTLKLNE